MVAVLLLMLRVRVLEGVVCRIAISHIGIWIAIGAGVMRRGLVEAAVIRRRRSLVGAHPRILSQGCSLNFRDDEGANVLITLARSELSPMAGIAWKTGTEVVVGWGQNGEEGTTRTSQLVCGSSSPATMVLVGKLVDILEAHGEDVSRCSRLCIGSLEEDANDLNGDEADQVRAMCMIWELCDLSVLCDASRRRGRLISWIKNNCVDVEAEADEYEKLVTLFRRISDQRGAPEGWQSNDEEASSPFWQLVYRLCRRGRTAEAWTVLELHSTNHRLSEAWAPIGSLLREMPSEPVVSQAGGHEAYEESRQRWRRRAARVKKAALRGDAELLSTVPPLRALIELLNGGDGGAAAIEKDADASESRLLSALLYSSDDSPDQLARACVVKSEEPPRDTSAAARRELLRACFSSLYGGAPCARAIYGLGPDVSCCAGAAVLAHLCQSVGRLADAPPSRSSSDLSASDLALGLAVDLADRLEVSGGWHTAAKTLSVFGQDVRPLLKRAAPSSDDDCLALARACIKVGLVPEARFALTARGSLRLAERNLVEAAAWYARAEVVVDGDSVDGPLEALCKRAADDLVEKRSDEALSDAKAITSGISLVVADENQSDTFFADSVQLLRDYVELFEGLDDCEATAHALQRILLGRPQRDHVGHLLDLLDFPNQHFDPLDILGFIHRLFQAEKRMSRKEDRVHRLRSELAVALADSIIKANKSGRLLSYQDEGNKGGGRSFSTSSSAIDTKKRNAVDLLTDESLMLL